MFVVSSFFCLWYATSLVDGVVLVAPCVMGIRWQKGITKKPRSMPVCFKDHHAPLLS